MRSLWTAASGMVAQQANLDTVANNLANVNTAGFKKSRIEFQDLLYENLRPADPSSYSDYSYLGQISPRAAIQVGHGVKISGTQRILTPGNIEATANQLDIAIDGQGFFRVMLPDSTIAYTRDGSFRVGSGGRLVTADGYQVMSHAHGSISIPTGVKEISISPTGQISSEQGSHGSIGLSVFRNPSALQSIGQNLYKANAASGEGVQTTPGSSGAGTLVQGYIERSNVQVVEEMVSLILVQRAYEMNSKAVQTSDDILGITNNLVRR